MQQKERWQNKTFKLRDGAQLHGKYFEAKSDYLVIFIHGGSFNSSRYVLFAENLKRLKLSSLFLDLRGHGESSGARGRLDYIGQVDDDLQDVFNQLACEQKILLAGHSSGAMVAMRFYLNRKINIHGLLLFSPAMFTAEFLRAQTHSDVWLYWLNYLRKAKPFVPLDDKQIAIFPKIHFFRLILATIIKPLRKYLRVLSFPSPFKTSEKTTRSNQYCYNMLVSCNLNMPVMEAVRAIDIPTFYVVGDKDEIFSSKAISQFMNLAVLSDSCIYYKVIENANHMNICNISLKSLMKWLNLLGQQDDCAIS